MAMGYPPQKKATDEQITEAYTRLKSCWRVAAEFGMCGQSVHERLVKLGINRPIKTISESDKHEIRTLYLRGFKRGDGTMQQLAAKIGHNRHVISRFARSEGLTEASRQVGAECAAAMGKQMAKYIAAHGHPRGALGMRHSDEMKIAASKRSKAMWAAMTEDDRAVHMERSMKAKLRKYGTLASPRTKVSWKQGWRIINGNRLYFRSRWEFNYGVYLQFLRDNGKILEWEHEPKTFWFDKIQRGCRSYLPDFRVTNLDNSIEYHEVKGWMDARSKTKLRRMAKYYPEVTMRIIDAKWFKANVSKLSWLPGWEPM